MLGTRVDSLRRRRAGCASAARLARPGGSASSATRGSPPRLSPVRNPRPPRRPGPILRCRTPVDSGKEGGKGRGARVASQRERAAFPSARRASARSEASRRVGVLGDSGTATSALAGPEPSPASTSRPDLALSDAGRRRERKGEGPRGRGCVPVRASGLPVGEARERPIGSGRRLSG